MALQERTRDLAKPTRESQERKHKLKRLICAPNSKFVDVRCTGCYNITTTFSHASSVVTCKECGVTLARSTGGKARFSTGCQFRHK